MGSARRKVIIKNLRLGCIVGVTPEERRRRQEILITAELLVDLSRAVKSDEVADTVDYYEIEAGIADFVEASEFKLIEALAEGIADLCLKSEKVKEVRVLVEKPSALELGESAGVEIFKEQEGSRRK